MVRIADKNAAVSLSYLFTCPKKRTFTFRLPNAKIAKIRNQMEKYIVWPGRLPGPQTQKRKENKTMQKTYNRHNIMQTDHTTFGGIIYPSDFNTESRKKPRMSGSLIAGRIAQDFRFDETCKKNVQQLVHTAENRTAPQKGDIYHA